MITDSIGNLQNKRLLSLPQLQIAISTEQINLFLAGVGSGKTHLDGMISYKFISEFPNVIGFIGANTYDQLNTSTFFRIREVWKQWYGIVEYEEKTGIGHYVVNKQPPKSFVKLHDSFITYDKIVSFVTGATIFLGSMDNAKAHDGKEFGWAILDETKDTKEDDVKDIILARLRQKGIYIKNGEFTSEITENSCCPLYISTSPAKVDWINTWFKLEDNVKEIEETIYDKNDYFVKRLNNKLCVISSTYHNEHNLPSNYIENKRNDWTKEKFKTLIYANPFSQTGSEYYSSFDRIKNVQKTEYDPELPLHISFDFNYVPYNSCSIWQVKEIDKVYYVFGIDEIALKNPQNSDEDVCKTFISRYKHKHKSRLFVYGDATGKAGTTLNKEAKSHIANLEKYLSPMLTNTSMRIPRGNPTNDSRRDFINRIFEDKLPIKLIIGENMPYMIADLSYTKQDLINGGKDKHIVTDPETKEKYQKYGHFGDNCFVGKTKITTINGDIAINKINVGDLVLTRNGYKKVLMVFNNGVKHVVKYTIGEIDITCTPDHKFYTFEEGFKEIRRINSNTFCIFDKKNICKKKLLVTTGLHLIGTSNLNKDQEEFIFTAGLKLMEFVKSLGYMFISILLRLAKFLKIMKYIIKTGILSIMKLITLNVYQLKSTEENIGRLQAKSTKKKSAKILDYAMIWLKNGISLKKALNGIKSMLKQWFMALKNYIIARNVKWNLNRMSRIQTYNIAVEDAKADLTQGYGEVSIDNVYDIEVEEEHEYFANGILVHNCEYFICECFQAYFKK